MGLVKRGSKIYGKGFNIKIKDKNFSTKVKNNAYPLLFFLKYYFKLWIIKKKNKTYH